MWTIIREPFPWTKRLTQRATRRNDQAAMARRLSPGGVWAWRRGGGAARGAGLGVSLAARAGRAGRHFATVTARRQGPGKSDSARSREAGDDRSQFGRLDRLGDVRLVAGAQCPRAVLGAGEGG